MCGIVGYTGSENCVPILMEGLTALAYRGYDSAGVAVWNGKEIALRKSKGQIELLQELLQRDEDQTDLHLPLLIWWALEAQCGGDRAAVLELFGDRSLWDHPITATTIVPRLMQRYALAGTPEDLETCAQLLAIAPSDAHRQGGRLSGQRQA